MSYYCPNCGNKINGNIFFQATGQCPCDQCGEIVDLTNVSEKDENGDTNDDES